MKEFLERRAVLAALCGIAPSALAQNSANLRNDESPVNIGRVPNSLQRYLKATGDRLTKPGKERVQNNGLIEVGATAGVPFQWQREFPGKLKVEGLSKNLVFDLDKVNVNQLDDLDEEILETLSSDTEDSFFGQWSGGNTGRFLGANFVVQGAGPGFGASVDVYEIAMPVTARRSRGTTVKHFMFDNVTGYLHKVAYFKQIASLFIPVVTELSNHQAVDGNPVPRRIVRSLNKTRRFAINVNQSLLSGKASDTTFVTGK